MKRLIIALAVTLFAISTFAQQDSAKLKKYSLPGKTGALAISMESLEIGDVQLSPDASMLKITAKGKDGIFATIFLEPAKKVGGAAEARKMWSPKNDGTLSKMGVTVTDYKEYEIGETAVLDFRLPEFKGVKVNQYTIHGYLAGGDLWADIHLSQTPGTKPEALRAIIESARMLNDYTPGAMDYFLFGSLFYTRSEYGPAANLYRQALEINERSGELDGNFWKVVVDNLGMAYGISGDLKRAKETFEAGLKKDPTYPMFYYNLACTYAEMNDLDATLSNLKKAFELRKNTLPGEQMPDPKNDDSFRRFLKNAQFKEFLKSIA